ncbi:hypothetical protein [Burkholderia alba]|uniref:hypothetical protein n=1 Tax=Burkholderia alba TaxID=2683677 RepID=UPI002B052F8E|nr:hypothetical protein [Burkholderia alba]
MNTPVTSNHVSLPAEVGGVAESSLQGSENISRAEGSADQSMYQAVVSVAQGALGRLSGKFSTIGVSSQVLKEPSSGFAEGPAVDGGVGSPSISPTVIFVHGMPMQIGASLPEHGLGTPRAEGNGPLPSGTDAPNKGDSAGSTDLEQGMTSLQQKDPTLFAKTIKDAKSGNGNELVKDELQAYKEGAFTKQQAVAAVSGAQKLANDNGGGKINGAIRNEAKEALGGSYIKGGQTRAGHAILKAFESFTPIGAVVKGVQDKTSKKPEDILTAAQPALQHGTQQAMQDMVDADPELAQKFQSDAAKGDGNAMVDDMIALKNEESGGRAPNKFSDQDAQLLGSQVGSFGKGKVSSQEDQAFSQAFGTDTLYRGSSRGAKGFDKFENTVGSVMQSVVSPVTSTVVGVNDLLHGNLGGFLSEVGHVLQGVAQDATMFLAPEAAPELMASEIAARGGVDAAGSAIDGISLSRDLNLAATIGNYSNDAGNLMNIAGVGDPQSNS